MNGDTAQENLTLCSAIARDLLLVTAREEGAWTTRVECPCGCNQSSVALIHESALQALEEHRYALSSTQCALSYAGKRS